MKTKSGFPELSPDDLRWTCPPEDVPFRTTSDCPYCDEIIGQERALKAIQTGLDIKSRGYNIFITGMVGTGRTTTIKRLLEKLEKGATTPDDILYVNNFKVPDEPLLLELPAGRGKLFGKAMDRVIEMLRRDVVEAVAAGKFHVYPVSAIDEGIEILTGIEAGAAREDGTFAEGTMNAVVDAELRRLAQGWKAFQEKAEKET